MVFICDFSSRSTSSKSLEFIIPIKLNVFPIIYYLNISTLILTAWEKNSFEKEYRAVGNK